MPLQLTTSAALLRFAPGKTNFEERLGHPQKRFLAILGIFRKALSDGQLFELDLVVGRLRHRSKQRPRFSGAHESGASS
jgi:hypothetical protein